MTSDRKIRILIVGSCVSRDIFEFCAAPDFIIADYFARTSFASLGAPPTVDNALLGRIEGDFRRRMVLRDMDKSLFTTIQHSNFDLILLDLIDDRFDIVLRDGGALTLSEEYMGGAEPADISGCRLPNTNPKRHELWRQGLSKFLHEIKARGWENRLVVNRSFWALHQQDGQPIARYRRNELRRQNLILTKFYGEIAAAMPQAAWLTYPTEILVADRGHKWGEAPFHFVQQVYESGISQLRQIAMSLAGSDASTAEAVEPLSHILSHR